MSQLLLGLGAFEFHAVMGLVVLVTLWVNVGLIAAAALIDVRRLRRRLARLGPFGIATVRRGHGPGGALARFTVRQRGRARPGRVGDISFHDQGSTSEVFGGELDIDGQRLQLTAPATARVWSEPAALRLAAACASPAAFAAGHAEAKSARGWLRQVQVVMPPERRIWLNGVPAGDGTLVAPPSAALVVSSLDPAAWARNRTVRCLLLAAGTLAGAAGVTALALLPPLFGPLSTLGAAAGLAFFLAVQPIAVAVRDSCRPPDRAYLRGRWTRPDRVQAATAALETP